MTKIYTRTGDEGETSLFGAGRVSKDDLRVEAYGAVDELNAVLGVVRTLVAHDDLAGWLGTIQSVLFDVGSELATPDAAERAARGQVAVLARAEDIERFEGWIDALDAELPPLTTFILPGGAPGAAQLHLARTVCRRAERRVVTLAQVEAVSSVVLQLLNRLSDLLFVMARAANTRAGVEETPWVGRERRG